MKKVPLFESVLETAIKAVKRKKVPVFTFAFYHDHESGAVSVCVDTEQNSARSVISRNRFNMRYFKKAILAGDLEEAGLSQANIGHSLELGDFELVNVARRSLGRLRVDETFYLSMIRSLLRRSEDIARLSPDPQRLIFACSGADDEVAYVWSHVAAEQSSARDRVKKRDA